MQDNTQREDIISQILAYFDSNELNDAEELIFSVTSSFERLDIMSRLTYTYYSNHDDAFPKPSVRVRTGVSELVKELAEASVFDRAYTYATELKRYLENALAYISIIPRYPDNSEGNKIYIAQYLANQMTLAIKLANMLVLALISDHKVARDLTSELVCNSVDADKVAQILDYDKDKALYDVISHDMDRVYRLLRYIGSSKNLSIYAAFRLAGDLGQENKYGQFVMSLLKRQWPEYFLGYNRT